MSLWAVPSASPLAGVAKRTYHFALLRRNHSRQDSALKSAITSWSSARPVAQAKITIARGKSSSMMGSYRPAGWQQVKAPGPLALSNLLFAWGEITTTA